MTAPDNPYGTPPQGGQPGPAPQGGHPGPAPQGWGDPPQQGGPAYGAAPASGWGPPGGHAGPARNGLGTAALVLGILAVVLFISIVGGIVLGLAAIVCGVIGRGRAKRGEATNGGMALAGIILGVIGLLASVALIAAGAAFFSSDTGRSLVECLQDAGADAEAQAECQRQFEGELQGS